VYNAAPKDGTVIGVALPTILTTQLLYPDQVKYDARKFVWLGSMFGFTGVISVLDDSPAKTIQAAKRTELVIGATGVGSPAYQDPALAKALLGLKFKIVTGYKGGNEVTLAMERGEVHGRSMSSNAWEAQRPDWVRDNRLVHLLQIGPGDPKRMAGVPRLIDLVPGEREKEIARFAEIAPRTGWTVYLPPGVPADRAAALRSAFAAAFKDPVFVRALADATKADIAPVLGDEFTRFVDEVMATPEPVLVEVRRIFGQGS
jgi:tripartite-type tricarboxylate transporter receptor subunit TctC